MHLRNPLDDTSGREGVELWRRPRVTRTTVPAASTDVSFVARNRAPISTGRSPSRYAANVAERPARSAMSGVASTRSCEARSSWIPFAGGRRSCLRHHELGDRDLAVGARVHRTVPGTPTRHSAISTADRGRTPSGLRHASVIRSVAPGQPSAESHPMHLHGSYFRVGRAWRAAG